MKKIHYKELMVSILIPLVLGGVVGFLTANSGVYDEIIKPSFAPPSIVFPIAWTILYILMGISSYLIYQVDKNSRAFKIYVVQLIVNLIWPFLFFSFQWFLLSFLWLLLLIGLVIAMIVSFYKLSKPASLLQLPYLLWTIFAGILNFSIYLLNR